MPRGPAITNEVKRLIAEVNDKHPDYLAKEVKEKVQELLQKMNMQAKPDWPGLSAVQVELKKIRERKASRQSLGIDGVWSLGRLTESYFPPEAISKLLEIQETLGSHKLLTIREARWVGHLYALFSDTITLAVWSVAYAEREKNCEAAGIENDTSDIDSSIQRQYITIPFHFIWLLQQDWIPDSYKRQLAEEQTRKYEDALRVEAERPDLTTKGWLIYAQSLQRLQNWGTTQSPPKLQLLGEVFMARMMAKREGKILSIPEEKIGTFGYIDYTLAELSEDEELPTSTEEQPFTLHRSARQFAEELRKFSDPDFVEFMRKGAKGDLLKAINRALGITDENGNKSDVGEARK
jgi:hypothetical protein